MDRLPVIARLQYETVAQLLLTLFEQALGLYEQGIALAVTPQVQAQLQVLEGRMTWLTYMVGAIIGAQSPSEPRRTHAELLWDGQLCRCVFRLVQIIDMRSAATSGQGKCSENLEIAILNYFQSFKKVYMTDNMSSPLGMTPSGNTSPAHPLLAFALSYSGGVTSPDGTKDTAAESSSIFDSMGIGDITAVMNLVVTKMCNNIKYWHLSNEILEQTLEVFVELVSSYSSSKTLLGLDTVNFLVHNHVGQHFPFLGYDTINKHRITFYSALSRLVFSSAEDLDNSFDAFIAPNVAILVQLNQTTDLKTPAVKIALIGKLINKTMLSFVLFLLISKCVICTWETYND